MVSAARLAYSGAMPNAARLLLALLVLAGCARETGFAGPGERCVRSTECMAGLACVAGQCSTDLSGIGGGTLPPRPMDAGSPPDAGPMMDAGAMDAGFDSGAPPVPDSGPPPVPDSGPPPMPDSGPPPMPDAGPPDSGPPPMPDSGPPPAPDGGPPGDGG